MAKIVRRQFHRPCIWYSLSGMNMVGHAIFLLSFLPLFKLKRRFVISFPFTISFVLFGIFLVIINAIGWLTDLAMDETRERKIREYCILRNIFIIF